MKKKLIPGVLIFGIFFLGLGISFLVSGHIRSSLFDSIDINKVSFGVVFILLGLALLVISFKLYLVTKLEIITKKQKVIKKIRERSFRYPNIYCRCGKKMRPVFEDDGPIQHGNVLLTCSDYILGNNNHDSLLLGEITKEEANIIEQERIKEDFKDNLKIQYESYKKLQSRGGSNEKINLSQLKIINENISNLSNRELLKILTIGFAEYREETLNFAKEELEKRNIPKKDVKEEDKDDQKQFIAEISVKWLNFYTHVHLPLLIIWSVFDFIRAKNEIYPFKVIFNIITFKIQIPYIVILAFFVLIGLYKRRIWGWELNFILLIIEISVIPLNFLSEQYFIFLIVAGLCWFLPNFHYFIKRRHLFTKL